MRLYGLAINRGDNSKFIGVYPILSAAHKVLIEMADTSEGLIAVTEIPTLTSMRFELNEHGDFFHEFSDGTKVHVQEIEDELVVKAVEYYHLEREYNAFRMQEVTQ